MLTILFKTKGADGTVSELSATTEMAPEELERTFRELNMAIREKRPVKFAGARFDCGGGEILESAITERWSVGDMRRYLAGVKEGGEAVFRICERGKSRKPAAEDWKGRLEIMDGDAFLSRMAGIPERLAPYLDRDRLLADIGSGAFRADADFLPMSGGRFCILD